MSKKIWGNCIVKNEDRYIYFAVKSVIEFLDKMLIWDTGSSDNTVEIVKGLINEFPGKIEFKAFGSQKPKGITSLRQQMLEASICDWIFILDGDEVWWENSIRKIISVIEKQGDNLYAIVTPVINLVGDIYHYQEEMAGKYEILGKKGHLNIRAINRKIPGLHLKGDYPLEAFYDKNDRALQMIDDKLKFIDTPYLHFTHLPRSTSHRKFKYELGIPFPKNFKYPEVFYLERPLEVPSPWVRMSSVYKIRASIETPLKKLKRRIL